MKKLIFVLSVGIFSIGGMVSAVALPESTDVYFSVVNVAKGNEDATKAAARPGDTLRYELKIVSDFEDVSDFEVRLNISNILQNADIIDVGSGSVVENELVFPPFSQVAPCEKIYTFFVRVKSCTQDKNISVTALGKTLSVNIVCKAKKLITSGGSFTWWMYAVLFGMIAFVFGVFSRKSFFK